MNNQEQEKEEEFFAVLKLVSVEQMKMFLTRFGFGSKVVVTGDITQIDLPKDTLSGLVHSLEVLKDIDDVVSVAAVK